MGVRRCCLEFDANREPIGKLGQCDKSYLQVYWARNKQTHKHTDTLQVHSTRNTSPDTQIQVHAPNIYVHAPQISSESDSWLCVWGYDGKSPRFDPWCFLQIWVPGASWFVNVSGGNMFVTKFMRCIWWGHMFPQQSWFVFVQGNVFLTNTCFVLFEDTLSSRKSWFVCVWGNMCSSQTKHACVAFVEEICSSQNARVVNVVGGSGCSHTTNKT